MKEIYLDNSATTPLSAAAREKLIATLDCYGNPSAAHPLGLSARDVVEEARREILMTLGVRGRAQAGQLIFTASGTEGDNLAILGSAYAKPRRRGGTVISTDCEHPGVENALVALEQDGFRVIRIATREGVLDWEQYAAALTSGRVFLVTMMQVNNETGAMFDLRRAFSMAKAVDRDIVTHTDAVQSYLKCRLNPSDLGADLVTISGHKIGAPKGVGALYVSPDALRRRDLLPRMLGGGQEAGFRSGTENVLGIAAFGAAAKEGYRNLSSRVAHLSALREEAIRLLSPLPVRLHLPRGQAAPHILNFALPDIKSETALHALAADGICVSAGSACSTHAHKVSRALTAFGLSPAEAECSLRLSLGDQNAPEDLTLLLTSLAAALDRLVRIHR